MKMMQIVAVRRLLQLLPAAEGWPALSALEWHGLQDGYRPALLPTTTAFEQWRSSDKKPDDGAVMMKRR
jgi:hypothetical protein